MKMRHRSIASSVTLALIFSIVPGLTGVEAQQCRPLDFACKAKEAARRAGQSIEKKVEQKAEQAVHAVAGAVTGMQGDVPGSTNFRRGGRVLFADDWSRGAVGELPGGLELVGGVAEVVESRGRRFLSVSENATFDLLLPEHLPESYTVEFLAQVRRNHPIEIRPELPGVQPGPMGTYRPAMLCGPIRSGVYGPNFDYTRRFEGTEGALAPCQISVDPRAVRVHFAGALAGQAAGVQLQRTNRLRLVVPGIGGQETLIGPIVVATDVGAAPQQQVATAPPQPAGATPPEGEYAGQVATQRPRGEVQQSTVLTPAEPTPSQSNPAPAAQQGGGNTASTPTHTPPAGRPSGDQQLSAQRPLLAAMEYRGQGLSVKAAAQALVQEFTLNDLSLTTVLLDAGYPPADVFVWLKTDKGFTLGMAVGLVATGNMTVTTQNLVVALRNAYNPQLVDLVRELRTQMNVRADLLIAALSSEQLSATQWVTLLLGGGYDHFAVAEGLKIALNRSAAQMTIDLTTANVAPDKIALALVNSYNANVDLVAELLRSGGVLGPALADVLVKQFKLGRDSVLKTLIDAGFGAPTLVQVLGVTFGVTDHGQISLALRMANVKPEEAINAIAHQLNLSAALAAKVLFQGGYAMQDVVTALKVGLALTFPLSAGALLAGGLSVSDFSPHLVSTYSLAESQLVTGFKQANFTALQTAEGLKAAFAKNATATAQLLSTSGYSFTAIKDALIHGFSLTVDAALALLQSLGIQ